MANLNRCTFIGRLTRDPEARQFVNGGQVANFGLAFTGSRKKNEQTGEWEEVPCFVDCKAFDRENGRKLAELCAKYLKKGHLVYVEGNLTLEKWVSQQDGTNRQAHRLVVQDVQFLQPKKDGESQDTAPAQSRQSAPAQQAPAEDYDYGSGPPDGSESEIPF